MIRTLLALACLIAPAIAYADWYEASTDHFVVYLEDSPERLERFATQLEQFDKALRAMRGLADVPVGEANRVVVYVVDGFDTVERLARVSRAGGFYRARAGGSLAVVPRQASTHALDLNTQEILLHEYTHHLMRSLWPSTAFPSWFVEGYAEFHATARFERDGGVSFGLPPQYRGQGLLLRNALPAERLLTSQALTLKGAEMDGLYGRGWLLTHYLSVSDKRPKQLEAYLTGINSGKTSLRAATDAFGDLRALDRELESYKTGKFLGWTVPASLFKVGPIKVRKLTPGEAATMDVRITSKNGVDEKTAPRVYAQAKRAAAPFPNDPGAQIVLAEAAYDARDYSEAEAAADRAIAANPRAVDAFVYKAMARMAVARNAGDKSRETWAAIRKLISAANRLDPEDPEPLILFYRSFAVAGLTPTKNAREGLYTAFQLGPQDLELRMTAVESYLQDNNAAMARDLLRPVAYDPHNQRMARIASDVIAVIDTATAADALKVLESNQLKEEEVQDREKK